MDAYFIDYYLSAPCLKYLVLGFNSIFMMSGVILISTGSTIFSYYNYFNYLLEMTLSPATLLIATGVFIFFIALAGYFAVIKESTLLVNTYCVLLCFVFLLQLSAGIAAITLKGRVGDAVSEKMNASLYNYAHDQRASDILDLTQSTLKCCGKNGPGDWYDLLPPFSNNTYEYLDIFLPDSCCDKFTSEAKICLKTYSKGCLKGMRIIVFQIIRIIFGSSFTLAVLQLCGIYFTHCFASVLIKLKSKRLAAQIIMRNQLESAFNGMEMNINSMQNGLNDKPPSYEEVIKQH